MWFQEISIPTPPLEGHWKFERRKPQFLKESMKLTGIFREVLVSNQNAFLWGGGGGVGNKDIFFSKQHIHCSLSFKTNTK